MSSPNEIYWSTIYNYFASNAAAPDYTAYPLSSPESRNGCTSNPSTAFSPSFQSEVAAVPQEDGLGLYPSPQALYPSPHESGLTLYSPYPPHPPHPPEKWEEPEPESERECPCGFDFCEGFCEGLVDDVSPEDLRPDVVKAGIIESDDAQPDNTYDDYNTQLDGTELANLQLYDGYNTQLGEGTQLHDPLYPSYPSYEQYPLFEQYNRFEQYPPFSPYPSHSLYPSHEQCPQSSQYNDPPYTHYNESDLLTSPYPFYLHVQQEQQASVDAWAQLYLNSPEPQKSVDTIPCESGWERRVWGVVTKKLREGRGRGKWEKGV